MVDARPTHTHVDAFIHGSEPPFRVLPSPVGPCRSAAARSTVTDACTAKGRFEFVMLPQDTHGGSALYGLDPEIDNEEP